MKTSVFFIFFLFSAFSMAASDQIPRDRTITNLYVYGESVVVEFTPEFTNTQNCPETSKTKAIIDLANGQNQTLYTAALSAAMSKTKVGFGLAGCDNNVLIYRVDLAI